MAIFSVAGGKFHRPADPNRPRGAAAFKPALTACHRTLTPLNHFDTVEDALSYCGGRTQFLCRQCKITKEN